MADFAITAQSAEDVYNAVSGTAQRVMRVRFRDELTQTDDYVDVPIAQYGPDVVLTLISERLQKVRAVHALDTLA